MKTSELTSEATITSTDGKRTISVSEFDHLVDSGSEDVDAFLDWTKAKRGGARSNAGRKPRNSVRLEIRIRPDLREKLRRKAKHLGTTQVKILESVLEKL